MENKQQAFMIKNVTVYAEDGIYKNGYICVKDGKITGIGSVDQIPQNNNSIQTITLSPDYTVVPGMIDVHIHGAAGADMMDATPEALDTITTALPREGTTSFLATTITQEKTAIDDALENNRYYMNGKNTAGRAEILGVHLEGPFINPDKAGAQPPGHIIHPDIVRFQKWQEKSGNAIKLVTLAPEREGGLELVRHLKETGVVASIGHSDATYTQVAEAIEDGITHVTHLFNGMRGLHHREPGVAGAALLRDELFTELIADGIHSRPELAGLVYRQKGAERIILITDAMRAKCMRNGTYDLGGQQVTVKEGKAVLKNGSLAGSILRMNDALKNFMKSTDCTLKEVVKMGSENPAKQLGVYHRKGSIADGKDADFVILDSNSETKMTFCRGIKAYEQRSEQDK